MPRVSGRKVAAGETVFDPKVEQKTALRGERSSALTQRELEVLQMIVDGKSTWFTGVQLIAVYVVMALTVLAIPA